MSRHNWFPSDRGNAKRSRRALAERIEAQRQQAVADAMAARCGAPHGYFYRQFGCLAHVIPTQEQART